MKIFIQSCIFTATVFFLQSIENKLVAQNIIGPDTICNGGSSAFFYSTQQFPSNTVFHWVTDSAGLFNQISNDVILQGQGADSVNILFTESGWHQITLEVLDDSSVIQTLTRQVYVLPVPVVTLPPVWKCSCADSITLPWGDVVNVAGTYSRLQENGLECDIIEMVEVLAPAPIINWGPLVHDCNLFALNDAGQYYKLANSGQICHDCNLIPGQHPMEMFCLCVYSLSLPRPHFVKIEGTNNLHCTSLPDVLRSQYPFDDGILTWFDAAGNILGNADTLVVQDTGLVVLRGQLFDINGNLVCEKFDSVFVRQGAAPFFQFYPDTINCLPNATLEVSPDSISPNLLWKWFNKDQTYTSPTYTATQPGKVFFLVKDTLSGCEATGYQLVNKALAPKFQVHALAIIGCDTLIRPFVYGLQPSDALVSWTMNGGPSFTSDTIPLSAPEGNYYIRVTDAQNGCYTTTSFTLDWLEKNQPLIVVGTVTDDSNNTGTGAIQLTCFQCESASFQWYHDNMLIGQNKSITGLTSGFYECRIHYPLSCDTTLFFTVDNVVSTAEQLQYNGLTFYPNPVKDKFVVKSEYFDLQDGSFQITSALGQIMDQGTRTGKNNFHYDCSHFPEGVYCLWMTAGEQQWKILFVVER